MASPLDMSLDDLIKSNKTSAGRGGGGGRGRGSNPPPSGPTRRSFPNRSTNRSTPYPSFKAPEDAWQHDMYSATGPVRGSSIETGIKLYVSNLDYEVSNEDIKELFSEVGDLKRCGIHYDRSGRSKGTAEIVFSRQSDALAAVKRYNNVQLDGKPMKVEVVGTNIVAPPAIRLLPNGGFRNSNGFARSGPGRGSSAGRGGGASGLGGRGRERGRGQGRGRSEPVSVAALDAELDKYHAEAMKIN